MFEFGFFFNLILTLTCLNFRVKGLDLYILSNWKEHFHSVILPFDYEPNALPSVHNQKENCHCDHILFELKGSGNIVFPAYTKKSGTFFLIN